MVAQDPVNSINEDDSGIYFCKVGNTVIQQFEIIVRGKTRPKAGFCDEALKLIESYVVCFQFHLGSETM